MTPTDDLRQIEILVKGLDAKKGTDIVVLDLRQQSSYLTYFVIVTALSKAHLRTLFDEVHKIAVENNFERPRSQSPQYESGWVTYDFGFYVVHLFEDEKRKFYNLENIWKGATRVDFPETRSNNLNPRKGESEGVQVAKRREISSREMPSKSSARVAKKTVNKKAEKTAAKPKGFPKKKTTIKKKTTKEIKMATAKKKPAKKKAAKKPAKKKAAKKK